MTVRLYRSTDAGAPTLSGTAGSLITVLDAVLVNGYGSTTAAGWTVAYTATNVRAYRQGTGSNNFYLRVNDTGTRIGTTDEAVGSPVVNEARVRGYETMTGITDAGTGLFPTVAQLGSGMFVRKSFTANTIARPWVILADQRTLYIFVLTGDTANNYLTFMFGEFYSFKPSDGYRAMIIGRVTENYGADLTDLEEMGVVATALNGHFIARDASGSVGAITAGKGGNHGVAIGGTVGTLGNLAMANPTDHAIYIFPLRVFHSAGGNTVRGRMRGLWHWGHPIASCSDGDRFSGQGDLVGKSFLILKQSLNGSVFTLETSDTWDTN